jgi:hypothetical protein
MHLSKNFLYFSIIGYCVALLIFQDWGSMSSTVGTASALWLGKMVLDLGFVGVAFLRIAGPALFADDDAEDDVAFHAEDMAVSDTALFGLFLVNILANGGYHGYETITTTGTVSFYFSLWFIFEVFAFFLTLVLFSHARKTQAKLAKKARAEAAAKAAPKAPAPIAAV